MSNTGRAPQGRVYTAKGNLVPPSFLDIGTYSGLSVHGVLLGQGLNPFIAAVPAAAGTVLMSNGPGVDPSFQSGGTSIPNTITGNSGGALSPIGGNFNILGTGSITVVGSANTETVQLTGLTNHAIQIGAGTATLTQLGSGTTGQILRTNTGADPTWSTATYPSTAGTSGNVLTSDGTNWSSVAPTNLIKATTYAAGTSGTHTLTANTNSVSVIAVAGGGGGGSGRQGTTAASSGGGGGAAGGVGIFLNIPVSFFGGAGAGVSYSVGSGGAGGTAQSSGATNGINGTAGGNTTFGFISPGSGAFGGGGTNSSGSGGTTSNYLNPYAIINASSLNGALGATAGGNTSSGSGGAVIYPSAGGGGGGGGLSVFSVNTGGAGSSKQDVQGNNIIVAASGGSSVGQGGNNGTSITTQYFCQGLGGGGGAGGSASVAGGKGGNGGTPGGAGGGGGGSVTGAASGAGGTGGDGILYIYEYL